MSYGSKKLRASSSSGFTRRNNSSSYNLAKSKYYCS